MMYVICKDCKKHVEENRAYLIGFFKRHEGHNVEIVDDNLYPEYTDDFQTERREGATYTI